LQKVQGSTSWDAKGEQIKNVGAPTLTADATTKQYVDDKVNQLSSGASAPPTKWVFTGTAGANTTYSVTDAEVNGDTAYDVSVDGSVLEPTTDYTVDPDTDTLTIVNTLSGGEDIVVIERGFGVAITGTIGADQLQSNAVTTAKLADHSVTAVKISNTDPIFNVQTTGEVGIGTTSPTSKVTVSEADGATLTLRRNSAVGVLDDLIGKIDFYNNDTSVPGARITATIGAYVKETAGGTYLVLNTAPNGGSNTERMRIDSAGNVGIGTTSPGSKLEINSGTNDSALHIKSSDGFVDIKMSDSATSDGGLRISAKGNDLLLQRVGGNVGIGTISPSAPLEVDSTTGGVVFPRLTTTQRDAISSPTNGETIFNTTNNQLESYNGSDWVVGGGGVSKYTTGWTNISSTLANDTEFTFTHNLGTTDILVNIYASTSPTGTAEVILVGGIDIRWDGANQIYGAQIVDITTTTLKIRTGSPGWNKKTSGSFSTTNWNASYIKVVAVG
jgi:hypothetical protein